MRNWQENPYKYMARSTVFVLSSISEALPNVLTEAMASGCPVISANCSPGVCEIIGTRSEYGLLAEPMTGIRRAADEPLDSGEESLLTLMRKVIDDKELREEYIRRGKERAEFFALEKRVKEYEEFIRECVGEK